MKFKRLPSADKLHAALECDPDLGILKWRSRPSRSVQWNGRYAGKPAFTFTSPNGYKSGRLNRESFLAHRVIWALCYGEDPAGGIDHINGDPSDNRLSNLRLADQTKNMRNVRKARGLSPFKGVHLHGKKWRARVKVEGRNINLGSYDTQEDAARAYDAAAQLHYGPFASINFPLT